MKKYARISSGFITDGAFGSLKSDDDVNKELNQKFQHFFKKEKVKDYRIINAETVINTGDNFTPYII
jgi:hypothetical protein